MRTLIQLVRYNAWANRRLVDLCATAEPALLREADRGSTGSAEETLKHMVEVEDLYLVMIQGGDIEAAFGDRETYWAQESAWFMRRAAELGDAYLALLDSRDEAWLDEPMRVPWFDFPMTTRDGLLQALTHSAQHRTQVFSTLGAHGIPVPEIDYVIMVGEQGGTS